MGLSLECYLVLYLAPGRGCPLDTGLPVTVLCAHRALGHLGTSLVWHWDRTAFCCQALARHSPCLCASTTAPCAGRPGCYHPPGRERRGGQGAGTCHCLQVSWYELVFSNWTKDRQQWVGSFTVWFWNIWVSQPPIVFNENCLEDESWENWKFFINLSFSRLLGPRINFLVLKTVFRGLVNTCSPGTGAGQVYFYFYHSATEALVTRYSHNARLAHQ